MRISCKFYFIIKDLIEKLMALKYSMQTDGAKNQQKYSQSTFNKVNTKLAEYAKLLADQGCFLNAYSYINDLNDVS
jgi:hypothetical protein